MFETIDIAATVERCARLVAMAAVLGLAGPMGLSKAAAQTEFPALPAGFDCTKFDPTDGPKLNLAGARVTFEDEFDKPGISTGTGPGPWFTSIHGGLGKAKFVPYRPDGQQTFIYGDGKLTIRMQMQPDGQWTSGLIQSVDRTGTGFAQRFGYFEMRAKFPAGSGNWPAFWLKTVNEFTAPETPRFELDVIEAYGGRDQSGFHSSFHVWPPPRKTALYAAMKHSGKSCYQRMPAPLFDGEFHTYGVDVGPQVVKIYYDRHQLFEAETVPLLREPLFILVDLALLRAPLFEDHGVSDMVIDYVRVWQRPEYERR